MVQYLVKHTTNILLKSKAIDGADREIYEYGLELLISTIMELLAVITVSLLIGRFFETVLFLIPFCFLRTYAGGFHAKTHLRCFLTLASVYAVFISCFLISNINAVKLLTVAFTLFSTIVIIFYSPVESENKPLGTEEKLRYRKISITASTAVTFLIAVIFILPVMIDAYLVFSISFGQLTAACSLVAVKILKNQRRLKNESIKNHSC